MTTTALAEIAQLSVAERIKLAEDIWDTIASAPDELPLPDTQRAELDRRLQAYRDNPQPGVSWPQVQQRAGGRK
jgi:putative addiction module component (TIGR02574 family)